MNEQLVSIKRLAEILDCSPKTVRDWMYRNRRTPSSDPLPYYRVGGLVRFRLNDVMGWIDRRRVRISPLANMPLPVRERPAQTR
jgi:excisionase family DNA binding protein